MKAFLIAIAALAWATPTMATDEPPIDLAAAITCKASPDDLSLLLMLHGNDPDYGRSRGWTRQTEDSPYLARYRLPRPITVFGRTTDRIAFTANTVFAVLTGTPPARLGTSLGVVPDVATKYLYVGARKMSDTIDVDRETGDTSRVLVALHVTTWMSRRGEVLAGCSYSSTEGAK